MKIYLLLLIAVLCLTEKKKGLLSILWDCCKPSCSFINISNGHPARQCDVSMNILDDPNAESLCDGGISTTCLDQMPIVVNDKLAYAFAAIPEINSCGKCYELIFTGKGKYETTLNHQKLFGKKLIVIGTNIGWVSNAYEHRFELLVPGGEAIGFIDGCPKILGNNIGRDLLLKCEIEVGYRPDDERIYKERKSCLASNCKESFTGIKQALEGCLFLANWLEAASYALFEYEEVECPQELLSKY